METLPGTEKKKHNLFLYLSILLFITSAVLAWKVISLSQQKNDVVLENTTLSVEKQDLISKLETLKTEYEQLSSDNAQLSEMFQAEKQRVESLIGKIKNTEGSVAKYKKQVSGMELRLKEYEQQIEELKSQNKELVEENFHIKTVLDSTSDKNEELVAEKEELTETVAKGTVLNTYDVNSDGIYMKNNGKEIPTKKSKRIEKVRVCFTIGENAIAAAGSKTIYLRIADPSGTILALGQGDEYAFDYEGGKLQYSAKENINYNNKALDICMYWIKNKELVAGNYTIDIFAEGKDIGTSTLTIEK